MIDRADTTDYRLRHGQSHMTGGGSALWGMDPAEICARMEEESAEHAQREREALRDEIFNALMEYLFADGPEPWSVSARARAFLAAVADHHPSVPVSLLLGLKYEAMRGCGEDDFWVESAKVEAALHVYGDRFRDLRAHLSGKAPLSAWFAEMRAEADAETVWDTLRFLSLILFSQGHQPRQIAAAAYCLAKTLKPHLIASMSLHTIAILSGDEGGRATPQARCKRIYTLLLEEAGARATRYHHQKSSTHSERCRAAQMGNSNRNKNTRHPRK
jgi:hypothetical protein